MASLGDALTDVPFRVASMLAVGVLLLRAVFARGAQERP